MLWAGRIARGKPSASAPDYLAGGAAKHWIVLSADAGLRVLSYPSLLRLACDWHEDQSDG